MGERQRGRDPNRHRREQQKEESLPEYHQAARYPDEPSSEASYTQARRVIYDAPCDLSVYRLMLLPDSIWHVAVLGSPPSDDLHRRLTDILSTGEPVLLPNDTLISLNQRRREQSKIGSWVERYHRRRTRK